MLNFPDETRLSIIEQTHKSPLPLFFSIFPGHLPLRKDNRKFLASKIHLSPIKQGRNIGSNGGKKNWPEKNDI